MCVRFALGQLDNRLNMVCVREHIHGLNLFDFISVFDEIFKVSFLSFGVTGNVDNFLRIERNDT